MRGPKAEKNGTAMNGEKVVTVKPAKPISSPLLDRPLRTEAEVTGNTRLGALARRYE